ncbi:MAG: tRNA preQ1(34) S-adenosylmethionine ribosyltransferase-isomerase QueA [Planctomycetota bacterium]
MRTDELSYDLPEDLIATRPAAPRDSAKLLVISRSDPQRLEHRLVRDLPGLLRSGDRLVVNTSRVLPARFAGRSINTGGKVSGLYLRDGDEPGTWIVLLKMRRHRVGSTLEIEPRDPGEVGVRLTILGPAADEDGAWVVRASDPSGGALDRIGLPPLPPYILSRRDRSGEARDRDDDPDRYQTVYAEQPGSVAAPTAGLHFTPELFRRLGDAGIARTETVLHVGRGTFAPVEAERVEDHPMHAEWCSMTPAARAELASTRAAGGRVIAVGTTSCRTIESFAAANDLETALTTRLLITPGYRWLATDGLLTNFHLPRSTLLAMVAALLPGGVDRLMAVYAEAIRARYRFYSFGDAMLVLP